MTVGVAHVDAQRDFVFQRNPDIGALERVGIRVVDSSPVGVELVTEEVVIETAACSGERHVAVGGGEVSAVGAEAEFGSVGATGAGPDLNYAGPGVGAVECALGAAEEFHAVGFG